MKNLEEKKLLLNMMRAFGQDDKELAESIRREEELTEKLFGGKKIEPPVIVEETKPEPVVLQEADPIPPAPAFTPPTTNTVIDVVNVLKTANANTNIYRDKEIEGIRRTIGEMMQKISTMSWGGGGTGVVRFIDLDDHFHPQDVRVLAFNPEGTGLTPTLPGSIGWNATEDCLNVYQEDGTTLQVGLENYIRVKNLTGNTINNGTLVQFAGVNGGFDPVVTPLIANTTFDPIYTVGVLTESIANGENGRATTFGKVRGINTTGIPENETWNIGNLLWADPVHPGRLTNIKPTAPNVAISIAAVTRVDATEGEILVRPTITPRLFYGTFAQTANQALSVADTAYPVLFDKTNFTSGHTLTANGVIVSEVTGLFKYDVNYNITSSNSSRAYVYMWIRKNGVDQQNTALRFSIESNGGEAVPHGSFVLSMQPGDNVQMMIAASGTSISLFGLGATGIYPSAPSAVLSISQMTQ
jgi:hypothetical protein